MKKIVIATVVIALVSAGGFYIKSQNSNEDKATEIETTKVAYEKIIQKVNATGKIQPKTKVNISADVSAKIIALHVKEGDWVEKGKLLVELDKERYMASVESQEANVRSAKANAKLVKANIDQSKRVWQRSKELVSKKI